MKIQIKLLTTDAKTPTRGSDFAAGYDFYTTEDYELKPGERHLYKTGVSTAIPNGVYGRIAPRSGLAYKNGIDVMAGVIDSDYRGEIGILLVNLSDVPWRPIKDKPIAQMIFEYHNEVSFDNVTTLPDSARNAGGFGHSDQKRVEAPKAATTLLDKFKESVNTVEHSKYETIVREREKLLG